MISFSGQLSALSGQFLSVRWKLLKDAKNNVARLSSRLVLNLSSEGLPTRGSDRLGDAAWVITYAGSNNC